LSAFTKNLTVDLIVPWMVNVGGDRDLIVKALTVIAISTTLDKIIHIIDESTGKQVTVHSKYCRLAIYPRPI
jgi:hypothetical protein